MTQSTIPGTAPITQRELAERRAALPLKPNAVQRQCDHGLFSDDAKQVDLMDVITRL